MPLTITKKYQYVEYLGPNRAISALPNLSLIRAIIGISDDGNGYISWESDTNINSLASLDSFAGYLIVSKDNNPNYTLYTENDLTPTNTTSKPITQTLTIAKYKSTSPISITSLLIKDNIQQIFGISNDGFNPISWSKDSRFNSLTTLNNDISYLIVADPAAIPFDFWSQVPPTPTPTQTVTPTPTITPGLAPSTTPTNTPTNTPTPSITATISPTPTSTPLPPNKSFSVVFDQPVYYFNSPSNHKDEYHLISATIVGEPNKAYQYTFESESDNAVLAFDNVTGSLALEETGNILTGKIFSNLRVTSQYGQGIVRCSVTDVANNDTIDALCVVIINPVAGIPTPYPTPTQTVTPSSVPVTTKLNTVSGTNVSVGTTQNLEGFGLNVTYDNVSTQGLTNIAKLNSGSTPSLPANFRVGDSLGIFSVTSTASFSGNVKLCFTLPSNTTQAVFDSTRIFHLSQSGQTTDATILTGADAPNFATKKICASVQNFSQFFIIPQTIATTPTPTTALIYTN